MEILRCFEPITPPGSRVLVLGTMPGAMSLARQEYYGFPQNAFWRIMAALTDAAQVPDAYAKKVEMLRHAGIALWDVCRSCRREGSLDSNILDEVPNDIAGLLDSHPSIRAVVFNGGPAHRLFKKHIGLKTLGEGREVLVMPSTSPANASYSFDRKFAAWSELKKWL